MHLNIMGIKKNPIAVGVVGLVFGTVLGIVIDKHFNKCKCNENISNAKMQAYAKGDKGIVGYKYSFTNEVNLAEKYKNNAITTYNNVLQLCQKNDFESAFFESLKIYAFPLYDNNKKQIHIPHANNEISNLYLFAARRDKVSSFDSSHLNDFDEKLDYKNWYMSFSAEVENTQKNCYDKIKDIIYKDPVFTREEFTGQNDTVF